MKIVVACSLSLVSLRVRAFELSRRVAFLDSLLLELSLNFLQDSVELLSFLKKLINIVLLERSGDIEESHVAGKGSNSILEVNEVESKVGKE